MNGICRQSASATSCVSSVLQQLYMFVIISVITIPHNPQYSGLLPPLVGKGPFTCTFKILIRIVTDLEDKPTSVQ